MQSRTAYFKYAMIRADANVTLHVQWSVALKLSPKKFRILRMKRRDERLSKCDVTEL